VKFKLFLVVLSIQSFNAFSATSDVEKITIFGNRVSQQSGQPNHIVTREQINKIAPSNLTDLLKHIPHVQLTETSLAGGLPFLSIRGGETNFTLIMIDGVIVNNPTNSRGGGFDFNQLSLSIIERVEIYRGGTSAIFGGEAISGAINFITKSTNSNSIAIDVGNKGYFQGSASVSQQFNNTSALITVSRQENKGLYDSYLKNNNLLLKLETVSKFSKHAMLATYSKQNSNAFGEDSGGETFALPKITETRDSSQKLLSFSNTVDFDNSITMFANLSLLDHEEFIVNPGIFDGVLSGIPSSDIVSRYKKSDVDIFATWGVLDNWQLTLGANQKYAKGSNIGTIDFGFQVPVDYTLKQKTSSVYAESKSTYHDVFVSIGLRYDDSEDFSDELSTRFNINYQLSQEFNFFAVIDEGYKLPSFFALAHPLVGNPELTPERSRNQEIGLQYSADENQKIYINYFYNEYSDLVDFDAVLFTSVNRSNVTTKGVEFGLNTSSYSWPYLAIDVTYLDVKTDEPNIKLRRRPNWFGNLSLDFDWNYFTLSTYLSFKSDFYDSSIPTGLVKLDGYGVAGMSGNWQYSERIRLHFAVSNVLSKSYQESVGFVNDDALFKFGINYVFK
jgi:vitamin B12 transporter